MARLLIEVGSLSAEKVATDAAATTILQAALRNSGADIDLMSGAEQAQAVIDLLVAYIQHIAHDQQSKDQVTTAKENVEALRIALADAEASLPTAGAIDDPPFWGDQPVIEV